MAETNLYISMYITHNVFGEMSGLRLCLLEAVLNMKAALTRRANDQCRGTFFLYLRRRFYF